MNGIRIWYAVFGQGEPVIFIHGGMGSSDYWGLQVPAVARHYQVIVLDSRGQGRGTWNSKPPASFARLSAWKRKEGAGARERFAANWKALTR